MSNNLVNQELLSCIAYTKQPSNSVVQESNYLGNQKATTSLKDLALKVLQSNQQSNSKATNLKNQSNIIATDKNQKLYDFIFNTYGVTITQLQEFLGDDWAIYKSNPCDLLCWSDILSNKQVLIALGILKI